ncbi:unnamed protein product [Parascedosporium putredinis]|uniref:cyclin-dependent kinase n=1 Tax=Parascedosporium putredinis TaxID=1442378 RepID=A0A9P1H2M7_9PEZI|nr:unnamed protein product [Parascedosporium putredinis]CAI7995116.1 unnamed protein product [Parascedosporium putredinis]
MLVFDRGFTMLAEDWRLSVTASFRYDVIERFQEPPSLLFPESAAEEAAAGFRIGPYHGCLPVGEGLTSTVYRAEAPLSQDAAVHALKVVHPYQTFEPHNPQREVKILKSLNHSAVIALLDSFRDQEQRLNSPPIQGHPRRASLRPLKGIIHRDIKPSAILLDSEDGPAYLSDFGTAWHPDLSPSSEPAGAMILDIGTGAYRPPDALFGNKSYSTPADMWSLGVLLSESASTNPNGPTPIFESPPTHEDGSQLGLILSIFRTLGTPTPETWPEATKFKTTPFGMWRVFEPRAPDEAFASVQEGFRGLVASLLRFESGDRPSAEMVGIALQHECMRV